MSPIQKTIIRLSSSTSSESSTKQSITKIVPNRLTTAYNKMREVCPDDIQLYAKCILNHQTLGTLEKDCCATEFAAVKKCFHSVRR